MGRLDVSNRLRPHINGCTPCSSSCSLAYYPQCHQYYSSLSNVACLVHIMTDTGEGDDEFQFLRTVSQTVFKLFSVNLNVRARKDS